MSHPNQIQDECGKREDESILSFKSLEDKIGYHFNDNSLLKQALTHRSYCNEIGEGRKASNERLEFLGDAVLELCSSEKLYRQFPDQREGELSKARAFLVCEQALSEKAEKISLGEHLLLGKGEEKTGGRHKPSVTSDALEALIGAVYLDGGMKAARALIDAYVLNDDSGSFHSDYKTQLQEYVQQNGNRDISYRLMHESGPDHDKRFEMVVEIDGTISGKGTGRSKKAAEQMAAKAALTRLSGGQE